MLPLGAATPPSWVYPGAFYDLDFSTNRYWTKTGGTVWFGSATAGLNRSAPSFLSELNAGGNANQYYTICPDGILRPQTSAASQYFLRINGYGLWVEGSAVGGTTNTNYALWSRDLTNAVWSSTAITTAKTSVGADGVANSATRLTATNATNSILQSITLGSRQMIGSAWVKRITGVGTFSITIDNGATWTDISSLINSSTYTQIKSPAKTAANPIFGFQFGTNGDAVDVDFTQCENNDVATNPIVTTTVTLNRAPEGVFMSGDPAIVSPNSGQNILAAIDSGHPAAVLVQYSGNFSANNIHNLYGDVASAILMTGKANGDNRLVASNSSVQTVTTTNAENIGLFNLNKACASYNGTVSGLSACLNGGPVATAAGQFSPYLGVSFANHGGFANRGAGDTPLNGYIKRFTAWTNELTPGQMVLYTTIINNT